MRTRMILGIVLLVVGLFVFIYRVNASIFRRTGQQFTDGPIFERYELVFDRRHRRAGGGNPVAPIGFRRKTKVKAPGLPSRISLEQSSAAEGYQTLRSALSVARKSTL